jgi:hypothetical protein
MTGRQQQQQDPGHETSDVRDLKVLVGVLRRRVHDLEHQLATKDREHTEARTRTRRWWNT